MVGINSVWKLIGLYRWIRGKKAVWGGDDEKRLLAGAMTEEEGVYVIRAVVRCVGRPVQDLPGSSQNKTA